MLNFCLQVWEPRRRYLLGCTAGPALRMHQGVPFRLVSASDCPSFYHAGGLTGILAGFSETTAWWLVWVAACDGLQGDRRGRR
jgi:hypothetical protein